MTWLKGEIFKILNFMIKTSFRQFEASAAFNLAPDKIEDNSNHLEGSKILPFCF